MVHECRVAPLGQWPTRLRLDCKFTQQDVGRKREVRQSSVAVVCGKPFDFASSLQPCRNLLCTLQAATYGIARQGDRPEAS